MLLDIQLPDVDGLEVAERLADGGGPAVVLTSTRDEEDFGPQLSESGARGFVPKDELSAERIAKRLRMTEAQPLRVVMADDSVLLREGIASLLGQAGFEIVGQSSTAEDLLLKVRSYKPDVAIVDIRMPPTHTDEGLGAAKTIREQQPDVGGAGALAVRGAGVRDGADLGRRRGRWLPAQGSGL